MSLIQAFTLGIVQGITEFLPISSSGFLILIPEWLGWEIQSLSFDAIVHFGTLAAVIWALWPEVLLGFKKWKSLGYWIILATIPIVIVGFFAQDFVELALRSTQVVAWSFIVWGIVLYFADRAAGTKKDSVEMVGWKKSLVIGFAQVLALIPGTSRSGITITAGLFGKLTRETATKFSFLLGIPTIAAAGLLKAIPPLFKGGLGGVTASASIGYAPLLIGFITSVVAAFLTIKFLLTFLKTNSYTGIAIFRILLGVMILLT